MSRVRMLIAPLPIGASAHLWPRPRCPSALGTRSHHATNGDHDRHSQYRSHGRGLHDMAPQYIWGDEVQRRLCAGLLAHISAKSELRRAFLTADVAYFEVVALRRLTRSCILWSGDAGTGLQPIRLQRSARSRSARIRALPIACAGHRDADSTHATEPLNRKPSHDRSVLCAEPYIRRGVFPLGERVSWEDEPQVPSGAFTDHCWNCKGAARAA